MAGSDFQRKMLYDSLKKKLEAQNGGTAMSPRDALAQKLQEQLKAKRGATMTPNEARKQLTDLLRRRTGTTGKQQIDRGTEDTGTGEIGSEYINRFMTDAQNFTQQAYDSYQGLNWATAQDQAQSDSRATTLTELEQRAAQIRTYLQENKNRMHVNDYNSISQFLDNFAASGKQIQDAYANAQKYYAQFGSQDEVDLFEAGNTETGLQDMKASLEKELEDEQKRWEEIEADPNSYGTFEYSEMEEEHWNKEKALKEKLSKVEQKLKEKDFDATHSTKEGRQAWYADLQQQKQTLEAQRQELNQKLSKADNALEAQNHKKQLEEVTAQLKSIEAEMRKYERGGINESGQEYGTKVLDDAQDIMAKPDFAEMSHDPDYDSMTEGELFLMQMEEVWNGWEDMTEEETKVFNYLWNTKGKEAANEYRDELQRQKNRVASQEQTQKMQEKYQSADVGGKVLMNILSVPANVAGGALSAVSDVGKILQGQEIDPNNAMHQLMGYGTTVRQEAASDLDETGIKLPVLDFTLGDAYQAGMSMADSLLSAAFGGTVGGVLLATGAASNEAARLYEQGASNDQVAMGALLAGAAEMVFEKYSIEKLITMKNPASMREVIKNALIQGGIEASEESMTEIANTLTNAMVMGSQSDWNKLLEKNDGDAVQALLEKSKDVINAGLGGFLSGAGSGAVVGTVKYATNKLTDNEKAVVQLEYENRLKEAQKDKKLTKAEQTKLYNAVVEDLKNGEISTDVIEEALGGDQYKSYREAYDQEESRKKELETELKRLESEPNTVGNAKKYDQVAAELEQLKKDSKVQAQKNAVSASVWEMVKDGRLGESYAEKGRRGEAYKADLSKYNEKEQAIIKAAEESGILNNSKKTHRFVDMLAKIGAQKGLTFDFTTNQRLKESGFAIEGATVNGYLNGNGVTINVNSAKALNSVVGHEITHVLEGTEMYDQLADMLEGYARNKGEYDSRMESLKKLYAKVDGFTGEGAEAKLRQELVADLVGDYLFTDKAFVEKLSTENRNLFQKIYDEIKYLCRMATAGSKELRQLEKAKRIFEDAYRLEAKNPTEDGGVRYSLGEIIDATGNSYGVGVHLDSTLLDNLTEKERVGMVKEYVKELGGKPFTAYDPNGNAVDITIAKPGAKFKNKSGKFRSVNKDLSTKYIDNEVKQEAIALVDELITTAEYNTSTAPRYPHGWLDNDGKNNWEYWTTYIQDKNGTIWEATLNIANSADGEKILYDISPIKKVGRSVKSDTLPTEDSIRDFGEDVNRKNSLSDAVAEETGFPLPWEVRGKDVALVEEIGLPLAEEYQNRGVAEARQEQARKTEAAVGVDTTQEKMAAEGQETAQEKAYLSDEIEMAQREIQHIESRRKNATEKISAEIDKLKAKKATVKNEDSAKSLKLAEQIRKAEELRAGWEKEYQLEMKHAKKKLRDLQRKQKKGKTKQEILDEKIAEIDAKMEEARAELESDFAERKAQMEAEIQDKGAFIKKQANALYKELQVLKKGVKASADLGAILDRGDSWNAIKSALLSIADSPVKNLTPNFALANNIRQMLEEKYQDKQYQVEELVDEWRTELQDLEDRTEGQREAARTASQRRAIMQEYENLMARLVGDTSTWKDKKLGVSYWINTLRRNLRDVVRDEKGNQDLKRADAIYDELQGKYNHNEAELKRETARIKDKYAEMGITKEEDAYIQMLGELRYNPDTELSLEMVEEYLEQHKAKIDEAKVDKVIEMARADYDALLQRLNAVLVKQGMKKIPYRKGYFPHFTEQEQGKLAKFFNWKVKDDSIPTDIAGLTEAYRPQRSWQSFNKQRTSDTTTYSFLKGMDNYVQGSLDWIYHIEDIQKRRALENYIRYIHSDRGIRERIDAVKEDPYLNADEVQEQIDNILKEAKKPMGNFVQDLRTGTNILAGKKNSLDRGMESATNRKIYSVMTNISKRTSANMVAGSISSAFTNFIPITQSWGQVSPVSSLKAMLQTIRSAIRDDGVVDQSDFLTNRLRNPDKLYKETWDKVSEKVGALMEAVDSFTSQTVWRSKYMENLADGMSETEAIKNADQFAENVLAGRSRGNMPTAFDAKNPIAKLATAFQLEVANQYGYMLKDMPQDMKQDTVGKLVKGYATMFLGAYVYNMAFSALTGRDAALDPIGIVEDLIRGLSGEEEPEDAVLEFAENVLQETPFIGGLLGGGRVPISSAMPYDGAWEMVEGLTKDVASGDWMSILEEMTNPLYYAVAPMGGGQVRKTVQGLGMYLNEVPGSYTNDGRLRYTVEDEGWKGVLEALQAGAFGKWANENAQQYIEEGRSPLSKKQTQEFFNVGMDMQQYWDYLDGLRALDKESESGSATLNQKGDYIGSLDLTVEQKNILINNLADRKEPIDMSTYDQYPNFEQFDYATKNPEKYALAQAVGFDAYMVYSQALGKIEADKNENGDTVAGSREKKVKAFIDKINADDGVKMLLYKSQYKGNHDNDTKIVDYLNSREDLGYGQVEKILKLLGAEVDEYGYITWD